MFAESAHGNTMFQLGAICSCRTPASGGFGVIVETQESLVSLAHISHRWEMAADEDVIIPEDARNPFGHPFIVEVWNRKWVNVETLGVPIAVLSSHHIQRVQHSESLEKGVDCGLALGDKDDNRHAFQEEEYQFWQGERVDLASDHPLLWELGLISPHRELSDRRIAEIIVQEFQQQKVLLTAKVGTGQEREVTHHQLAQWFDVDEDLITDITDRLAFEEETFQASEWYTREHLVFIAVVTALMQQHKMPLSVAFQQAMRYKDMQVQQETFSFGQNAEFSPLLSFAYAHLFQSISPSLLRTATTLLLNTPYLPPHWCLVTEQIEQPIDVAVTSTAQSIRVDPYSPPSKNTHFVNYVYTIDEVWQLPKDQVPHWDQYTWYRCFIPALTPKSSAFHLWIGAPHEDSIDDEMDQRASLRIHKKILERLESRSLEVNNDSYEIAFMLLQASCLLIKKIFEDLIADKEQTKRLARMGLAQSGMCLYARVLGEMIPSLEHCKILAPMLTQQGPEKPVLELIASNRQIDILIDPPRVPSRQLLSGYAFSTGITCIVNDVGRSKLISYPDIEKALSAIAIPVTDSNVPQLCVYLYSTRERVTFTPVIKRILEIASAELLNLHHIREGAYEQRRHVSTMRKQPLGAKTQEEAEKSIEQWILNEELKQDSGDRRLVLALFQGLPLPPADRDDAIKSMFHKAALDIAGKFLERSASLNHHTTFLAPIAPWNIYEWKGNAGNAAPSAYLVIVGDNLTTKHVHELRHYMREIQLDGSAEAISQSGDKLGRVFGWILDFKALDIGAATTSGELAKKVITEHITTTVQLLPIFHEFHREAFALEKANLGAATTMVRKAFQQFPQMDYLARNLIDLYLRQGHIDLAVHVGETLATDAGREPLVTTVKSLCVYARALMMKGDLDQAEVFTKRALQYNSDHPLPNQVLAEIELLRERYPLAEMYITRAIQKQVSHVLPQEEIIITYHQILATALVGQGKYEDAISELEDLFLRFPHATRHHVSIMQQLTKLRFERSQQANERKS